MKKRSKKKKNVTDEIRKVMAAGGELKPGFYHVEILHDDGCPALRTERLLDCTCKPVIRQKKVDV